MIRFRFLDVILIIAVLSCLPSLIPSLSLIRESANPVDLGKPPMWNEPCGHRLKITEWSLVLLHKEENHQSFKRAKFETSRALTNFRVLSDLWIMFSFHEFTYFILNLWWRVHIPSNYLPTYNMTKKFVGGPVPKYKDSEGEKLLKNLHEWLQRVAVGMEGLVDDQFKYDEPFTEPFVKSYLDLQIVLCSVDELLLRLGIPKGPDVDRSLMTQDERYIKERNLRLVRDFNIVREYLNIMEYAEYVMQDFTVATTPAEKPPKVGVFRDIWDWYPWGMGL